jgi:hypothetical protein
MNLRSDREKGFKNKIRRAGSVAQMVEHLLSMLKALSPTPTSLTK